MAEPYTDADVELAARADYVACHRGEKTLADWDATDEADREDYRIDARAVLSALAAAGRLTPAGGRTRTSWAVRDPRGAVRRWPEAEARRVAAECGGTLLSSNCTTWPDGTALVGPWLPDTEGEDTDR